MNKKYLFTAVILIFGYAVIFAQESYNTLVYKGNQEFNSKNYESASGKYSEAVKTNEKDFTAHYNLGNSLYKRKLFDEAKAEYKKAAAVSTNVHDKAAALYNSGNAEMSANNSAEAAKLYKEALKQDPYNEAIRKNFEIAMLKEKEKEEQKKQNNKSDNDGGNGKEKDQNQGTEKGNTPQNQSGSGEKNKGDGEGNDPNKSKSDNSGKMPSDLEKSLMDRVENKERETAKRILNKNSYSMPQSNEKDW